MRDKLGEIVGYLGTVLTNTDSGRLSSYYPRPDDRITSAIGCGLYILLIDISSRIVVTLRFFQKYMLFPLADIDYTYIMSFAREDRLLAKCSLLRT